MGKGPAPRPWKPSWKDKQTGKGGEDQSKKWDYWPGSWHSPRRGDGGAKGAGKHQPSAFPAYDSRKPPEEDMTPVQVRRTGTAAPTPLVQAVQGAVNFARKLDMRQIKLAKELSDRQKCWRGYQVDMKRSYAKEKVRFEHDQSRLKEDLQKITMQQAQAYQLIQEAAAKGVPMNAAAQQAGEEEWDALVCDEDGDIPMDTTEQYLESLKRRFEEAIPSTPPRRPPGAAPTTPVAVAKDKAPRAEPMSAKPVKDPYMTSPSSTHFGAATEADNTAINGQPFPWQASPQSLSETIGQAAAPKGSSCPRRQDYSFRQAGREEAGSGRLWQAPGSEPDSRHELCERQRHRWCESKWQPRAVHIPDDELQDTTSPGFGSLE